MNSKTFRWFITLAMIALVIIALQQQRLGKFGDSNKPLDYSDFLTQIENLANQPEAASTRQLVVGQGVQFAAEISSLRTNIDLQRSADNGRVKQLVAQANGLIDDITHLNSRILAVESAGMLRSFVSAPPIRSDGGCCVAFGAIESCGRGTPRGSR